MKRRDLLRRLRASARARGAELEITEGGRHMKVRIGDRQSTVPRHNEINEQTARSILRQMGVDE